MDFLKNYVLKKIGFCKKRHFFVIFDFQKLFGFLFIYIYIFVDIYIFWGGGIIFIIFLYFLKHFGFFGVFNIFLIFDLGYIIFYQNTRNFTSYIKNISCLFLK